MSGKPHTSGCTVYPPFRVSGITTSSALQIVGVSNSASAASSSAVGRFIVRRPGCAYCAALAQRKKGARLAFIAEQARHRVARQRIFGGRPTVSPCQDRRPRRTIGVEVVKNIRAYPL